MVSEAPPTLATVLDGVRAYLDIAPGEEAFVICALAAGVVAALAEEEPLWLMLVGPSGGGKTEAIRLLDLVADRHVVELTRAGLLSRGQGKQAKPVGLLTRLPSAALVTVSDFSTVITMGDHDARARIFGMLRVVYDGHVYRGIGGEPSRDGDELEWAGHLTLLAAATPAIEAASSFEAALGERWLTVRLPESSAKRARERARFVVERTNLPALRRSTQALARDLVIAARARVPTRLADAQVERLSDVAAFIAYARTGVQYEGQGRNRIAVGVPTPEEPTRLIGQLLRLARCCVALGIEEETACELAVRVAFDSVPLARMRALHAVALAGEEGATVADVHRGLIRGNRWAAIRELDALEAIGLVEVEGKPRDTHPNERRKYRLGAEWREVYESVAFSYASPPLKGRGAYDFAHSAPQATAGTPPLSSSSSTPPLPEDKSAA